MQAIHVCNHTTPEALYPFDARGIAKRFRHAAIFGALDALLPGETMRFCNDHDPLPLLGQLHARAEYARGGLPAGTPDQVRAFWDRLERVSAMPLSA